MLPVQMYLDVRGRKTDRPRWLHVNRRSSIRQSSHFQIQPRLSLLQRRGSETSEMSLRALPELVYGCRAA